MKRRDMLKTLALSPLFFNTGLRSLLSSNTAWQSPPTDKVFILLHGLLFLEYQGDTLVITAPQVAEHDYQIGTPDNNGNDLQPVPPNTVRDLSGSASGLIGNANCRTPFPSQLLQFSKKATGVGDLTGPFHFRYILPCPLDIVPLRNGGRNELNCEDGRVFASIKNHPGEKISLVTCLIYSGSLEKLHSPATDRCHFYAEPNFEPNLGHTNHALAEAKLVFAHWENFDLQLKQSALTQTVPIVPAKPPKDDDSRVSLSDALEEDPLFSIRHSVPRPQGAITNAQAVNVANCGQYGVTHP